MYTPCQWHGGSAEERQIRQHRLGFSTQGYEGLGTKSYKAQSMYTPYHRHVLGVVKSQIRQTQLGYPQTGGGDKNIQ